MDPRLFGCFSGRLCFRYGILHPYADFGLGSVGDEDQNGIYKDWRFLQFTLSTYHYNPLP